MWPTSTRVFCAARDVFGNFQIINIYVISSGESRIIFLPERCSISQYRPKISAINVKKKSRARLLLAHPVLYILKVQKTYGTFWKPPFQNQPKSVIGYVRQLALSLKVVQAMQLELSKFNTSHYSLLANTAFAIYIPKNSKPDTNTLYRLQGPRLF